MQFTDLGVATGLKEKLRHIYMLAKSDQEAEEELLQWCTIAEASEVAELKTMAKTVRNHLEGILAYWRSDKLTSASMEGFNNKIRWLIRQAYGYQDDDYFVFKIFDLPNTQTERPL